MRWLSCFRELWRNLWSGDAHLESCQDCAVVVQSLRREFPRAEVSIVRPSELSALHEWSVSGESPESQFLAVVAGSAQCLEDALMVVGQDVVGLNAPSFRVYVKSVADLTDASQAEIAAMGGVAFQIPTVTPPA